VKGKKTRGSDDIGTTDTVRKKSINLQVKENNRLRHKESGNKKIIAKDRRRMKGKSRICELGLMCFDVSKS
jgi:hypothetical protein